MSDGDIVGLTSLKNDVAVARRELKNIRKEIFTLKQVHKKEVRHLEGLIRDYEGRGLSCAPLENDSKTSSCLNLPYLTYKPIGFLKSVFQFKNGTPRQPTICQHSRGALTIDKAVFNNPEHSLESLEQFSHLWIIFVFHQNSNSYTKAKVKPPRLDGVKVGLFSTRSPYRPNPIGLTLAKMEGIEGATIHLSGIDILDGTPVLDIKPYIPDYDRPVENGAKENVDLNESQLVVGEEELSVLEGEVQEVLEASNASIGGIPDDAVIFSSPSPGKTPLKTTSNGGLESSFSELNMSDSKSVKSPGSQLDASNLSNVSLNRSLEIVKGALCESLVSDLNESIHDPLDPLVIIQSVKENMKAGKQQSPGVNNSVTTPNGVGESKVRKSSNTTKSNSSSRGYPFGNCSTSPGTSFQFGSTPVVGHSVSSFSDCDRSFNAGDSLMNLRRPANPTSTRPDLVFGKPTSQVSSGRNAENQSVSSSSTDTLCSNYADAFLSQSSDSILADHKVSVTPSFKSVSPQLKAAGLGSGTVSTVGPPKGRAHQKFSPPSSAVAAQQLGHSSRMSPKLRRLYANIVNGTPDESDKDTSDSAVASHETPHCESTPDPAASGCMKNIDTKKKVLFGRTEEDLSVIESEVQEILESSNASFGGKTNNSLLVDSPNVSAVNKTADVGVETAFSGLNLSDSKNMECLNGTRSQLNASDLSTGTPGRGDSSVSLNRSLEIVKDALCGSIVSNLNDSKHDPLDPLVIIQSVKENMQAEKTRSPENSYVATSNDSGVGRSLNSTKNSSSSHGYPFGNCSTSPGAYFQFGTSAPSVHHSVSSVSDCDRLDAGESLMRLRRAAKSSTTKPDLVLGKPTSQILPAGHRRTPENLSTSSISSSNETLCSNYDDAFLSQSSDSILANQKVSVHSSFRCISPQLKAAGLGTGAVPEGGHPKHCSPVQAHLKKFSPPSYAPATELHGQTSRSSPKLRRNYISNEAACNNTVASQNGSHVPKNNPQGAKGETSVAGWIRDANSSKELLVSFTQRSEKMIRMFGNDSKLTPFRLRHLKSWENLRSSIESVLNADPRSAYRRQNCQDRLYFFTVDCAHITCWFDGNIAEVLKVQPLEFADNLKS